MKEKVIVVTGAGGVLCSEFARELGRRGARLALLGRTEESLLRVKKDIELEGGTARHYLADVTSKDQLEQAREQILKDLGACDILINGAGGNSAGANTRGEYFDLENPSFFELSAEELRKVQDLNFMGTLIPCQVFMKDMLGKGGCSVLNVSSMSAIRPLTKVLGYSAAKSAVTNFTQWLSVHFSRHNIRVNALAPGFFATKQNKDLLFNADGSLTERSKKILNATPMQRFGRPEELLGALVFLLDASKSGFVTGITLAVDGGFSAYSGV